MRTCLLHICACAVLFFAFVCFQISKFSQFFLHNFSKLVFRTNIRFTFLMEKQENQSCDTAAGRCRWISINYELSISIQCCFKDCNYDFKTFTEFRRHFLETHFVDETNFSRNFFQLFIVLKIYFLKCLLILKSQHYAALKAVKCCYPIWIVTIDI